MRVLKSLGIASITMVILGAVFFLCWLISLTPLVVQIIILGVIAFSIAFILAYFLEF